jgi:hypothetical protein
MHNRKTYHINSTESPATSLLALTKTLHPVVSKCLLGWPGVIYTKFKHYKWNANLFSPPSKTHKKLAI